MVRTLKFNDLIDRKPEHYEINGLDLVFIRYDENVSVLYGRCLHRGALMSDGYVDGNNLICGLHGWDYRYDTGVSEYNNKEALYKFTTELQDGYVLLDEENVIIQYDKSKINLDGLSEAIEYKTGYRVID